MTISTEDYARLAKDAYQDHSDIAGTRRAIQINGHAYTVLDTINMSSGYAATAYQRVDTREVVIAERGTEARASDAVTDFSMVRDETNRQWTNAQVFADRVLNTVKQKELVSGHPIDITVTGHSLGGTLAELTAAKYHLKAVTFNGYGAVDLGYGLHPDSAQVVNYVLANDVVSAASHHVGKVVTLATQDDVQSLYEGHYLGGQERGPNPLLTMRLSDHGISNFAPEPGQGPSVLSAGNASLYEQHKAAFDQYRSDVHEERAALGQTLRLASSKDLHSTLANLPPHVQRQLAEFQAAKIDAPIQNAVEHNPIVEGATYGLDQTAAAFQAGGQTAQHGADHLAQGLHAAGQTIHQRADEIARGAAAFAPIDPLTAGSVSVGVKAAGFVVAAEAEGYAQASHLGGQAAHAGSQFIADQTRAVKQVVEEGAHVYSQAVVSHVHQGEGALAQGVDVAMALHARAERIVDATQQAVAHGIEGAEHAAGSAFQTLTHPSGWFQSQTSPAHHESPAHAPHTQAITPSEQGFSRSDPRHPASPQHGLYQALKERVPAAGENRLLQFTAACHTQHITAQNLDRVALNHQQGTAIFTGTGAHLAVVDVKQPSPDPAQSIQQIQHFDQQQAQIQANAQNAIAKSNAQAEQGIFRGGPSL